MGRGFNVPHRSVVVPTNSPPSYTDTSMPESRPEAAPILRVPATSKHPNLRGYAVRSRREVRFNELVIKSQGWAVDKSRGFVDSYRQSSSHIASGRVVPPRVYWSSY